ncbi:Protein-S-isoprenylcysteine O-methyltransferase Ste14 [Dethiosulfatibacter aminovorans DSM 17477]|uniref:Protein-S-isoprenylcysteine O-methyltransferase Ste14 n=1 Tax=Dethiosulfatibacter aminovorans DSM 17477 TaxID=1121476 RepID=A0A1M6KZP3_9FIRM|nr:isoprenylcysteine carboxylmethyltransferase family protein [Dethiosulfatibacter aminovorans]SHJ64316.1 Protein-S-isoprenylcysteine O-methyltransferase Ste14 [Dethiosulfatibacter aminovorans DSM 17477]
MTFGKLLRSIIMTSIVFPGIIMLLGGSASWIEGWILSFWFVAMILSTVIYMYVKDPELLAERRKKPGSDNQESWDKYILFIILFISVIWLVVMPLDAERFSWSPPFPRGLKIIGAIFMILSLYFIYMSTVTNTYLSIKVRIQSERKQEVVSTGVYGIVRHPLYLGYLLVMLGGPLLLGSVIGLAIGFLGTITIAVRAVGEEKMLIQELEGYEEYMKKVKKRLVPFIW